MWAGRIHTEPWAHKRVRMKDVHTIGPIFWDDESRRHGYASTAQHLRNHCPEEGRKPPFLQLRTYCVYLILNILRRTWQFHSLAG